jgi:hypothetical protein
VPARTFQTSHRLSPRTYRRYPDHRLGSQAPDATRADRERTAAE